MICFFLTEIYDDFGRKRLIEGKDFFRGITEKLVEIDYVPLGVLFEMIENIHLRL